MSHQTKQKTKRTQGLVDSAWALLVIRVQNRWLNGDLGDEVRIALGSGVRIADAVVTQFVLEMADVCAQMKEVTNYFYYCSTTWADQGL